VTSSNQLAILSLVALLAAADARAEAPTTSAPDGEGGTDTTQRTNPTPVIVLGVASLWEGRFFRHTEFTAPNLRSYDANGYPSFSLEAELFPFANVGSSFWRGFGFSLRYAQAFGFDSESARLGAPQHMRWLPVDTSFSRYAVGLRYRIPVHPESRLPLDLAVSASLCGWNFDFGAELPRGPDLEAPTAAYRMIRLGGSVGVRLLPVTLLWTLSYLHAFSIAAPSSREIGDLKYPHLPTAVGVGAEIRGAVGVAIWRSLEIRLSAEYAVLAFYLRPLAGRADEPARVVDAYAAVGLGPYASF